MKKETIVFGLLGLCLIGAVVLSVGGNSTGKDTTQEHLDSIYAEADADTLGTEDEEDEFFKMQEDGTILVNGKYKMTADEQGISVTLPKFDSSPYFILTFMNKTAVFSEPTLLGIKYYDEYPCYNLSDYKETKDGVKFFTKEQELLPVCLPEKNLDKKFLMAYIESEVHFEQVQKEIDFMPLQKQTVMICLVISQNGKENRYPIFYTNKAVFDRVMSGMLHKKLYN